MVIQKCRNEDIAAAGAFYDKVVAWLDQHTNYPKWIYGVYPSEESVREMTKAGHQYICLEQDEIAGAFVLSTDPQGAYYKGRWEKNLEAGTYMVIHALAVSPERYGRGLAAEIIRFCADQAKKNGFQALRVDIVPENVPARKLYEKNGFTYAGDADLERSIGNIPVFSLYELNWQKGGI